MISSETRKRYRATIGIECHVQLKTKTKLFAAVGNDAREAAPNTLVSHICFGLPGALPVLNKEAVHLGMRAAFALGTTPQKFSTFDRKNYFYPDLPLGYQITQFAQPIVIGGFIEIHSDIGRQTIGITRAHLEADAGKSTHPAGKDYSLVDLNRAGTPLIEIVTEPDMHSAAEAKACAKELYLRMKYADVSYANLYYGNMRFDVNVSVSTTDELGTRSETKNLNSFRSVEKAVEYEIDRQIELLEKSEKIVQETRGWDDAKQKTFSQRSKEEAHDYRYFPEPDIPPIELSDDYIEQVRTEMPVMPEEWRERLKALGLDRSRSEILLEAGAEEPAHLELIQRVMNRDKEEAKYLANWKVNVEIPLRKEDLSQEIISNKALITVYEEMYRAVKNGKLSSTNAKQLLIDLLTISDMPESIEDYAQRKGYIQVSDEGEIIQIVDKVLANNPKAAEDVKNGEQKAVGFLIGQVMKASQGKANPNLAQELIKKRLSL